MQYSDHDLPPLLNEDLASDSDEGSEPSIAASTSIRNGRFKPRRGLPYFVLAARKADRISLTGRIRRKRGDLQTYYRPIRIETSNRDASEKKTQLLLAGQPTGWTAMARAIRDFDEEKVKNCKEDVDTLLVFAGLFSAVLTAFLIESYSNLLEDPATQTLVAIRQLVAQTSSYSLDAGMLNSTAPPLTQEPFQASSVDIRVNVLWFASLLLSLITASFGILIKQWLREFLAAENPSPQARLRLRHLRYPQLSEWKVFEIAAVLPLLLQIALALFFVGLCYFTASVHQSVKYTALPLVVGWSLCFSTVTILPLFCPQCPYRTTFLKAGMQTLHRWVGRITKIMATSSRTIISRSTPPSYRLKERLLARVEVLSKRLSVFLTDNDEVGVMRRTDRDVEILGTVDLIQSDDELLGTAIAEALDHLNCRPEQFEDFLRIVLENRGYPSAPTISVPGPHGPRVLHPFPIPILNLRVVPKPTRNAICTVISHYATNVRPNRGPSGPFVWDTDQRAYRTVLMCMIMLAVSDCPCPEDGLHVIGGFNFSFTGYDDAKVLIRKALNAPVVNQDTLRLETGRNISEDKPVLLLEGLGKLWDYFDAGTIDLLGIVVSTIELYGGVNDDGVPLISHVGPYANVDSWILDHLAPKVKIALMGLIVHGAASILRREHGTYVGIEFNIPAVLRGILRLSYSGQGYLCRPHVEKAFHVVFSALLARQDLALVLVDALLQAPMSWLRAFTERFLEHSSTLSHPTYGIDMYALDWAARLDNLTAAVLTRLSGSETGAYVSNIDALKICYFASSTARFLFIVQPPRKKWLSLFNILLDRIDSPTEGNKTLLDNEKAAMADSMLGMMYLADANSLAWTLTADGDDKVYKEWVTSRRRDDGIFPDRLFECIAPYSQKMREPGHWGVRRALEAVQMKTEEAPVQPQAAGPIYGPTLEKDDLCLGESSGQDQQRSDHASLT